MRDSFMHDITPRHHWIVSLLITVAIVTTGVFMFVVIADDAGETGCGGG